MSTESIRDTEVKTSIVRNLNAAAVECEQLAAGYVADGDTNSATDLHNAALRYRQLTARALGNWADADALTALTALTANADRSTAWDAETEACATQETREIPRVH